MSTLDDGGCCARCGDPECDNDCEDGKRYRWEDRGAADVLARLAPALGLPADADVWKCEERARQLLLTHAVPLADLVRALGPQVGAETTAEQALEIVRHRTGVLALFGADVDRLEAERSEAATLRARLAEAEGAVTPAGLARAAELVEGHGYATRLHEAAVACGAFLRQLATAMEAGQFSPGPPTTWPATPAGARGE